jgi:flagellar assembly protein FliH
MGVVKAVKYTFEESFDGGSSAAREREAEQLAKFQQELEAVRSQAYAEGQKAGHAQAQTQHEAAIANALNKISQSLDGLMSAHNSITQTVTTEATALAHAIGSTMAKSLMQRHPLSEIEELVRECLHLCIGEARIVIRVSAQMLEPLQHRLEALTHTMAFPGKVITIADDRLNGFDCLVEWPDGGIERRAATLENEINTIVKRHLQATSGAA